MQKLAEKPVNYAKRMSVIPARSPAVQDILVKYVRFSKCFFEKWIFWKEKMLIFLKNGFSF